MSEHLSSALDTLHESVLSNLRKLKYIVQFNKKSMFTGSQAYTIKPDPGAAGC